MMRRFSYKSYISIVSGFLIGFLFIWSLGVHWWEAKEYQIQLMVQHLSLLSGIFERINDSCVILSFEHDINYIDFLTVTSFVSSEVGPMNLKYPEKWQGPYLRDNPTIQEQYYVVLRTVYGHFIVPPDGVSLSDGRIVGVDIILDKDTDIQSMLKIGGTLNVDGNMLAIPIMVSV